VAIGGCVVNQQGPSGRQVHVVHACVGWHRRVTLTPVVTLRAACMHWRLGGRRCHGLLEIRYSMRRMHHDSDSCAVVVVVADVGWGLLNFNY
jgi:hypothetical protein